MHAESLRKVREEHGIAMLEASAIAAVMIPVFFAVYGLAQYIGDISALSSAVEQALSLNDRAPTLLSLRESSIDRREDTAAIRDIVRSSERSIIEMLERRGIASRDFSLRTFVGRRIDGTSQVAYSRDAGTYTPSFSEQARSELIQQLPASGTLSAGAYGIGVLLEIRVGGFGLAVFLKSLIGTERISISKIQRLRREVAWQ